MHKVHLLTLKWTQKPCKKELLREYDSISIICHHQWEVPLSHLFQYVERCHNPRDYTEDFNTFVAIGLTYLSPWSHCWGWSRTLCSYADSPPWLWCLRRGSYNQGTLRSSGTSSHCCGTVARPLNYMPRNWGPPPQNDSAETQEAHPVDLCVWEEREKSVYCHVILCELNWNLIPRPDKRFCKLHSTVFLLLGW